MGSTSLGSTSRLAAVTLPGAGRPVGRTLSTRQMGTVHLAPVQHAAPTSLGALGAALADREQPAAGAVVVFGGQAAPQPLRLVPMEAPSMDYQQQQQQQQQGEMEANLEALCDPLQTFQLTSAASLNLLQQQTLTQFAQQQQQQEQQRQEQQQREQQQQQRAAPSVPARTSTSGSHYVLLSGAQLHFGSEGGITLPSSTLPMLPEGAGDSLLGTALPSQGLPPLGATPPQPPLNQATMGSAPGPGVGPVAGASTATVLAGDDTVEELWHLLQHAE